MTNPKIATAADLERLLTRQVILPGLSAETGADVVFTIRRIHKREWWLCLPTMPASVTDGPPEDFERRTQAWLEGLDPDARVARSLAVLQTTFRIVQVGVVDPPGLTLAQIAALGDDAEVLSDAILTFSHLMPEVISPNGGPPAADPAAPSAA